MRVVGIVAEYNPLHNGHIYHIEQARKKARADYCVVVMSGNFVQRGEPACTDKYTRAQWAIQSGADLVLELPTVFAAASALAGADEALGRWWDAVGRVVLGVAPALDPQPAARRTMPESLARSVADTWGRIGFGAADVAERTWLSPACGLAGASPAWARVVGSLLREAAGLLESAD